MAFALLHPHRRQASPGDGYEPAAAGSDDQDVPARSRAGDDGVPGDGVPGDGVQRDEVQRDGAQGDAVPDDRSYDRGPAGDDRAVAGTADAGAENRAADDRSPATERYPVESERYAAASPSGRYDAVGAPPVSRRRAAAGRSQWAFGSLMTGLSRLLALATTLVVALIVAAILLRVFNANGGNSVVRDVHDGARAIVGPFRDMFSFSNPKTAIAVNWGIAGLIYLLVGGFLVVMLARVGNRARARAVANGAIDQRFA